MPLVVATHKSRPLSLSLALRRNARPQIPFPSRVTAHRVSPPLSSRHAKRATAPYSACFLAAQTYSARPPIIAPHPPLLSYPNAHDRLQHACELPRARVIFFSAASHVSQHVSTPRAVPCRAPPCAWPSTSGPSSFNPESPLEHAISHHASSALSNRACNSQAGRLFLPPTPQARLPIQAPLLRETSTHRPPPSRRAAAGKALSPLSRSMSPQHPVPRPAPVGSASPLCCSLRRKPPPLFPLSAPQRRAPLPLQRKFPNAQAAPLLFLLPSFAATTVHPLLFFSSAHGSPGRAV